MQQKLTMNRKELTQSLVRQYMKQNQQLTRPAKELLFQLAVDAIKSNLSLMEFYLAIKNKNNSFLDSSKKFLYQRNEDDTVRLEYCQQQQTYERKQLLETVGDLMELTDVILPLGSLVQLKKEAFGAISGIERIENLRVVITHRFIRQDEHSYFTYGGVIYPVANFNGNQILKFTTSLIEKVVHKGFRDEQEDAYVYLMKQEMILQSDIHMVGLREKEEQHEC